ncbi:unnamed protein product [Parnassius mnemosyne]|uniref:RNA-directed DNA polymerase n=1 Tax=Parnassius mnemosyne TaxID=213953 RepID=A0AAV1LYY5_9NEOP
MEEQPRASVETQAIATTSSGPRCALELPNTTPSASASASVFGMPTPPRAPVPSRVGTPPLTPHTGNVGSTQSEDVVTNAVERLLTAIGSTQVRSNRYFVSDFDPNVHDFDTWCDEVERARISNHWDDRECFARIGHCFKGESRTWLSQWTSSIRTWSNFKSELKALCPRSVDVANMLYDVMRTGSDKYSTYAEYARKSLLRLRIVKGLSSELLTAIIIRGIADPQIRAMAANAKLSPDSIVEFLSSFVKPSNSHNRKVYSNGLNRFDRPSNNSNSNRKPIKRRYDSEDLKSIRCYECNQFGHRSFNCNKRSNTLPSYSNEKTIALPTISRSDPLKCGFCKKVSHSEVTCFAKERANSRNNNGVNFCREITDSYKNRDVTTAVISGIPLDVLIDSGSCVSLMSKNVVKHFPCQVKPTNQLLRGLGGMEIRSESFVTLPVEFSDITIEIDFYVVGGNNLSVPVIIGTDVLNRKGITYVRTGDSQRIIHSEATVNDILQVNLISLSDQVNTSVFGNNRERLLEILTKYSDFFLSGTATTTVKDSEMHIKLTTDVPVYYRPYKLSHGEKLKVRTIVKDLLDKGIIRESDSEYASPILLVKKKDGSDRMVVDYRALNRITVKTRYPLPLINDYIDRLGNGRWFSSLDMVSGFHQLRVAEESIHKTAFVTPEAQYEYCKVPYGLANAPIFYQKTISKTLKSFIDAGKVMVYIDDVLIMTVGIDEHLVLLDSVMKTLTETGFSINLKKCTFVTNEIEYLGRIIRDGQVRPSNYKIDALVKSPRPSNIKQVRQFLGLAGYFRRYIPNYALKTAQIAALTRKGVIFNWSDEHEIARQNIISYLTNEPILAIFDPELTTELHTDASSIGYGGILMQVHKDDRRRVVDYFSKLTASAESKYHSYELETLAVVKSLQHFRQYLIGKSFEIVTDCNALKMTQRKKDLQPRVARWWIYMQDFDFSLEYRKGTLMSHVDYLSRNPVNMISIVQKPRNWAQVAQAGDEETLTLLEKLNNGKLDNTRYVKCNELLYYKYDVTGEQARFLCYVPKAFRLSLLRVFHDEHEHIGIDKTTDLILGHFWFPGLRQFVAKYVTHCVVCIAHKQVPRAPLQPISSWEKAPVPFETIHVDVLGPLRESDGHKHVLIIIDAYTKYCLLYALPRQDCSELKRVMTQIISLFGTFKRLVCDRSRMFDNHEFINWISNYGVEVHFITPEMHQENGQVERYCRTVLNMIRVEVNYNENDWSKILWKLQLVLNVTKHRTTQYSALNLLIGTNSTTPLINALIKDITCEGSNPNRGAIREIRRQRAEGLIRENKEKQDSYVNKNRKSPKKFEVNDLVYVIKSSQSTGKLDSGMRGPYKVTKLLLNDRYEVQLLAGAYGKTSQAAAAYMVLWMGEWTPETCAAFFEEIDDGDVEQPRDAVSVAEPSTSSC